MATCDRGRGHSHEIGGRGSRRRPASLTPWKAGARGRVLLPVPGHLSKTRWPASSLEVPVPALSILPRARMTGTALVRSVGARVPPPSSPGCARPSPPSSSSTAPSSAAGPSRVPDVAAAVGAGHSTLGMALLCLSLGALVCMRFTGAWCARFGAGRCARPPRSRSRRRPCCPGWSPRCRALCVALFVFGAATGMVNVAANAVGVQVEAPRRPADPVRAARRLQPRRARRRADRRCRLLRPGRAARTWRSSRPRACSSARGRCRRSSAPVAAARPPAPHRRPGERAAGRPPCSSCSARSPAAPRSARAR